MNLPSHTALTRRAETARPSHPMRASDAVASQPWPIGESTRLLQSRLLAAQQLVRPGFMTLCAVREGRRVVDFGWTFASAAAGRMLGRRAIDLYGRRLRDVLADHPGREALFAQYRRVVEQGAAGATKLAHWVDGSRDTVRHGAVRLGDGVAVTLINVSAAHRAHALTLALQAQQAMAAAHGG